MSTPGRDVVVTIRLEADPLFQLRATDAFLHIVRWLHHEGIVASATLDIAETGRLSAITGPPSE